MSVYPFFSLKLKKNKALFNLSLLRLEKKMIPTTRSSEAVQAGRQHYALKFQFKVLRNGKNQTMKG